MTKRDVAFLLIGLGGGLIVSAIAVVELVFMFHHMFIVGFAWRPASIAVFAAPFILMAVGGTILWRSKKKQ
jgi:uncharacterized iron-regulated membrane protein